MNFLPENDGIDHINVYSKGQTELGRFLSNFTYSVIKTDDGIFWSVEGYWYWLGTDNPEREKLRYLAGFPAKQLGRKLRAKDWQSSDEFKSKILKAIKLKIENYPQYRKLLISNTLPFAHYYVYGDKIFNVPAAQWILDGIEKIKQEISELSLK